MFGELTATDAACSLKQQTWQTLHWNLCKSFTQLSRLFLRKHPDHLWCPECLTNSSLYCLNKQYRKLTNTDKIALTREEFTSNSYQSHCNLKKKLCVHSYSKLLPDSEPHIIILISSVLLSLINEVFKNKIMVMMWRQQQQQRIQF